MSAAAPPEAAATVVGAVGGCGRRTRQPHRERSLSSRTILTSAER